MDTARLSEWVERSFGADAATQAKILSSVLIVLGLWLLRTVLLFAAGRRTEDARLRYLWRKTTFYLAFVLGLLLVGRLWIAGIQSTATFLGLLSAGLAVAFKDILADLAGWLYIVGQKPFKVGDRIEIGEFAGDVIDSGPFMFTLLEIGNWVHAEQSTGRMAQVPNSLVFTKPLVNYTKGFKFIWNEIPVLVTFESDWRRAKGTLCGIAERHGASTVAQAEREMKSASRQFMLVYGKLTPVVYTSVEGSGVLLTLRYLCSPYNRRDSAQAIWEDILEEFARSEDIDFAYPTRRVYRLRSEGKTVREPGAGPSDPGAADREDGGVA